VDVLTLTATPIPRTLQMAFTSLRDLSVIATPPPDRLAVRTQLCRFEESLVREAILREVRRGGQVFFVHNRVRSIGAIAELLQRIVPEVRVQVAHGQMPERELEDRMRAFLNGDYDLLLCTTIIESGLDMPRVNTILVDRADRLGLAQLYQLRGRVGRSGQRAYAYLLIPGEAALTRQALSGWRRFRIWPGSAAVFAWRAWIWRFAERAICSAQSNPVIWHPLVTAPTWNCWKKRCWNCAAAARPPARWIRRFACRFPRGCPKNMCPM